MTGRPGIIATAAPSASSAVNIPMKIGASLHERETPRSKPAASLITYVVDSGSTPPASRQAPSRPMANR